MQSVYVSIFSYNTPVGFFFILQLIWEVADKSAMKHRNGLQMSKGNFQCPACMPGLLIKG